MQYQGMGNGSSGFLDITTNTTEAPIDSQSTGSLGGTSLSATNAGFQNDDMILIHQTRGTGNGSWELNFIDNYTAGTITTRFELVNAYSNTGNNRAQVRTVPEYQGVNIAAGATYTSKLWNGATGGILFFVCQGHVQVDGIIDASGRGFAGGPRSQSQNGTSALPSSYGEGNLGPSATTSGSGANGSGGGAGQGGDRGSGGGGGGHASAGTKGVDGQGSGGTGGGAVGLANLSNMQMGGGGGSGRGEANANCTGGNGFYGGAGGRGGGIIGIFAYSITVNPTTGFIRSNGANGENVNGRCDDGAGGGGGGAAGSIFIKCVEGNFGTNRITATGGTGGIGMTGSGNRPDGGAGSDGRIRIESCNHTGSTNPGASESKGGHDYCQSFIHIY